MRVDDFLYIEQRLNIKLPESYKSMMLENYLAKTRYHKLVFSDPAKAVSVNLRLRKKCFGNCQLKPTHFVFAYDSDGSQYYFLDTDNEKESVYMFNRTKSWAYSPDNLDKNYRFESLESFVSLWRWFEEHLSRREATPPVELTNEQKREKREAFFAEMRKKREDQMKK